MKNIFRHKMNSVNLSNFLVLFLRLFMTSVISAHTYNPIISNVVGDFNKPYLNVVNRDLELMYSFELPDDFDPLLTKIQVTLVTNENTTSKYPLLATVIQSHEGIPLRLPFTIRDQNSHLLTYLSASRTLCIHSDHFDHDEKHFSIRIVTSSLTPVIFELKVLKKNVMKIRINVPVTIQISPTTPDFFYFQFPVTNESEEVHVKVKVTSLDETCSFHSTSCPVPDHAENVKIAGTQTNHSTGWEWETLTTKGAIVTSNKLISTPGFFIALLVTKDDKQCGHLLESSEEHISKITNLTIIVERDQVIDIDNSFWIMPISSPIILNFVILLICGFVCVIMQRHYTRSTTKITLENPEPMESPPDATKKFTLENPEPKQSLPDVTLSAFHKNFPSTTEDYKPSAHFGKMIIVIAIFFSIPVFELTTYNLTVLHTTGDNDICYYNSFCAHPLGYLKDFNHLWSNMGYIIFGFGFICITHLKKKFSKNSVYGNYAIPFKTGLYYAMGLGLIMEGVMSSFYHICPNKSNFQYDTCFMFIIAAMCILKIFDFRHPRNLGPYGIFTILALFSLISATGIILERYQFDFPLHIFRICISIVHLYVVGFFSVYTLYVGCQINKYEGIVMSSRKSIPTFLYIFPNIGKWRMFEIRWHRIVSVGIFWIANITVSLQMWFLDFASGILRFLIVNLIYYLFYYLIVKLFVYREFKYRPLCLMQPLFYLIATITLGIVSYSYFKIDLTEWRKSAAGSRAGNGECIFLSFYDEHDIWHMFSSLAILCLFMTLLTLDDNVQDVKKNQLMLI